MKKILFAVAFAISAALGGTASADTLNFANTPNGSDVFTATSISFVNPGSVGPTDGIFAGLNCTNCLTMTNFTSATATPFIVLTSTAGPVSVSLSSVTFTGTNLALTITGSGTATVGANPAQQIAFILTTQTTVAGTPTSYSGTISTIVPLPGALVLFGSGLVGLVALGKRRKKQLAIAA
jgi:hypothetical protein